MNGEYLRLAPDELAEAIRDPAWARELVERVQDAEEVTEPPPGEARFLSTHKAWQAIAFLLDRVSFPVDVVYGEEPFADGEDWGYGPPRYLTVDQVRTAAEALTATTFHELCTGVTPADLAAGDVYPQIWDEPDSLDWVASWYEPVPTFFAAAAQQGQAILTWLD